MRLNLINWLKTVANEANLFRRVTEIMMEYRPCDAFDNEQYTVDDLDECERLIMRVHYEHDIKANTDVMGMFDDFFDNLRELADRVEAGDTDAPREFLELYGLL